MNNVAGNPDYESVRKVFADRLMNILRENDDPRVVESPSRFEHGPYAGPLEGEDLRAETERLADLGLSALIPLAGQPEPSPLRQAQGGPSKGRSS